MPRPSLVIFDCDGVLVDSETVSNQVLVDNLVQYGLHLSLTECMGLFVGGTMKSVEGELRRRGLDLPADWVDQAYAETYEALKASTPLMPGARDLLDQLDAEGIAYAVASNGSEAKMQITLGQNDLWERFEGKRFSAHTLGVAKPDPGLFLAAAQDFGAAPEACVVIEDSRSGVKAARAAGMRCLGLAPEGDLMGLAALGAEIIAAHDEIPALIGLAPR